MKRLVAMLAALAGAFRTVTEWCGKTGRMISRLVRTPLIGGAPGAAAQDPDEPPSNVVAAVAERDGLADIRNLAGAMAAGMVTSEELEPVPDARIDWLMAMDRPMLARILCADDATLKAHIRGERSIWGVLAADKESVAAYVQRIAMMPDDYDAPAPEMAYAA